MTAAIPTVIAPPPAKPWVKTRLALMMFLQFAIQGAWLPLMFAYFNEHRRIADADVGLLMAAGAIGAIISPFISGQLADRYLRAEHFLAGAHLIGAGVVFVLAEITSFPVLLGLSFFYGVLYTPTMAVTNAIAFAHLPDRDRDFGKVRVWGTVGFIAAGIGIGQWLLHTAGAGSSPEIRAAQVAAMRDAFRVAAMLGVVLGLYSLSLPPTPPKKDQPNYAPGKAFSQIRRQPLLTLFIISLPVAVVHQFFFVRTAQFLGQLDLKAPLVDKIFGVGGAGVMTIGQISEIFVLALMPLLATRLSRKALLTIGLVAYIVRFAVFAYLPMAWALVPALALHGLVFGCFFFVCYMIVDEETTADVRASAQNLFNLIVFGLGVIVGNLLSGWLGNWARAAQGMNWSYFYAVPMWITVGCLAALLIFYPRRRVAVSTGMPHS